MALPLGPIRPAAQLPVRELQYPPLAADRPAGPVALAAPPQTPLAQAECSSGEGVIELAVRTALEPFVTRSRVRRSMLLAVIHDTKLVAKTSAAHRRIMHLILSRLVEIDPTRYREPADLLCLTLCGALLGSIRTTLFVEPDYRRELTAMVTHFVTRRDEA